MDFTNKKKSFDTKETSTSVTIPHPICPLFKKTIDLSTNTDAGITTSFGIGPLSIETKENIQIHLPILHLWV